MAESIFLPQDILPHPGTNSKTEHQDATHGQSFSIAPHALTLTLNPKQLRDVVENHVSPKEYVKISGK